MKLVHFRNNFFYELFILIDVGHNFSGKKIIFFEFIIMVLCRVRVIGLLGCSSLCYGGIAAVEATIDDPVKLGTIKLEAPCIGLIFRKIFLRCYLIYAECQFFFFIFVGLNLRKITTK